MRLTARPGSGCTAQTAVPSRAALELGSLLALDGRIADAESFLSYAATTTDQHVRAAAEQRLQGTQQNRSEVVRVRARLEQAIEQGDNRAAADAVFNLGVIAEQTGGMSTALAVQDAARDAGQPGFDWTGSLTLALLRTTLES